MPRSPQTHLFATREDLRPGLERIEAAWKLQYVLCDLYLANEPKRYGSAFLLEDLGINATGDAARSPVYLVMPAASTIYVKEVPQRNGGVRYSVTQLGNPDSIAFRPSGIYQGNCLVVGNVGTVSEDARSLRLYRGLTRELTRGFKKIRMYLVGPEALRMLDEGKRLVTMGVRSPAEYDLRR